MPNPGEQHANSIANPFEEPQRRISEFTAQEIATLQSRLEKQLGPEYISARSGPSGQKVHYIAAEKCIALANEVFGFNGWSSGIQNIQVDFVDENPQTLKISLGLSVIVRVTLRDGTFHEDIGYGHIENCKGKAAAFEKAKKEGTTDALKRALRSFGNVLGNCIYDKSYLAKVTKIKVEPAKFDEGGLHRHSDYVAKKTEVDPVRNGVVKADVEESHEQSADSYEDAFGEFDEVDFCMADEGHPDEVALPTSDHSSAVNGASNQSTTTTTSMQPPSRPVTRAHAAAGVQSRPPQTPNHISSGPGQYNGPVHNQHQHSAAQRGPPPPQHQNRPPQQPVRQQGGVAQQQQQQQQQSRHQNQPQGPHQPALGPSTPTAVPNADSTAPPTAGFFSARAVPEETITGAGPATFAAPQSNQVFNPRAESPSIRKTPGIDHSKSKPVSRSGQHVAPTSSEAAGASASTSSTTSTVVAPMASNGPPRPPAGATAAAAAGAARGNLVNPQLDTARRIGVPGVGQGSPLSNRGQYRPPMMTGKRPADAAASAARVPLGDLSNATAIETAGGGGPDAKKVKMG